MYNCPWADLKDSFLCLAVPLVASCHRVRTRLVKKSVTSFSIFRAKSFASGKDFLVASGKDSFAGDVLAPLVVAADGDVDVVVVDDDDDVVVDVIDATPTPVAAPNARSCLYPP